MLLCFYIVIEFDDDNKAHNIKELVIWSLLFILSMQNQFSIIYFLADFRNGGVRSTEERHKRARKKTFRVEKHKDYFCAE